ncbi:MAG: DUF3880 domain-containing protein [Roseburia sp.]
MNLLLYRYGSICEPDIIEGFEELGFTVDTITEEMTNKELTGKEQISLIQQAVEKKNYSFVFTINFFPTISEICNIYKLTYLSLIVDSPVMELYSNSICNSCNRIFLFDRALYEEFSPYNPDGIFHLPLATNVSRWDKVLSAASSAQKEHFSSDISFIGSLYSEKCPFNELVFSDSYEKGYVEGLMHAQEKVYGYFFLEEVISDNLIKHVVSETPSFYQFPEASRKNTKAAFCQMYLAAKITEMERIDLLTALGNKFSVSLYSGSQASTLPVSCRGRVKTHTEMPLVFANSTINLNMTAKAIRSAIPLRIWDVLGCHGFLISNYQSEIPEHFIPGEDIILYSSKEELIDLCAYYLEHPAICREIAENAYQKITQFHTYTIRLLTMLELAFK